MRIGQGRAAAVDWVVHYAADQPDFRGAYLSGSAISRPDDAELAAASDIDVVVVIAAPMPSVGAPAKPGKLEHRGVRLDVSYLTEDQLGTPEQVLGTYRLAGGLRINTIIADPSGSLGRLQSAVSAGFARRRWVRRRCEDARRTVEARLAGIDLAAPFHEQVTGWLFAAGGIAHLPLVAALRNPTVRLRYPAAREVLTDYRLDERYPELLELLGCADLPAGTVACHLDELARTFDATAAVARTPFPYSSDITPQARPIAIDGSRQLIECGEHREAVFWIVATFARCHAILALDAPDLRRELAPAFLAAVAELGIGTSADIERRAAQVGRYLPRAWQTAELILAANPEIVD